MIDAPYMLCRGKKFPEYWFICKQVRFNTLTFSCFDVTGSSSFIYTQGPINPERYTEHVTESWSYKIYKTMEDLIQTNWEDML